MSAGETAVVELPAVRLSGDELAGVLLELGGREFFLPGPERAEVIVETVVLAVLEEGTEHARELGRLWASGPAGVAEAWPGMVHLLGWDSLCESAAWCRATVRRVYGLEASAWPATPPAVSRVRDFDHAGAYLERGARHVWDDVYASGVLGGGA